MHRLCSASLSKTAGLKDLGMGALFGALLGRAGELVPQVKAMRESNPAGYDALLGASIVAAMDAIRTDPPPNEQQQMGDQPIPIVSPPGWVV